jgi:hypothetical protein
LVFGLFPSLRRDRYGRDAPEFLGSRVGFRRMRRAIESAGLRITKAEGLGSLFAFAWVEHAA